MPYFSGICAHGCKDNGEASELRCGVFAGWKQPHELIRNQSEFVWSSEAFSAAGRSLIRTCSGVREAESSSHLLPAPPTSFSLPELLAFLWTWSLQLQPPSEGCEFVAFYSYCFDVSAATLPDLSGSRP